LQKSRFTASKPSIFAIASDEKFIRHLVTSFHQRSLSQSAYQNDPTKPNFGTLTATTYGNGAKVSSRYDDFNRVTGVVYGEETAPRYEYDYNAKGQVARVRDNLLNRTTQSEYDLANRPVRVKTSEDAKHVYTGQVAYDNVYGNLSEFTEKVGENRQEYGTKFGYDDENRPTSLTYSIGATTIGQSTTTIDKLNRTTFSAVKLGSKTFTSEYHFAAGCYGTGSVTNLVASITQPGCNCGYGYDDNGNIASATLNAKWTGYTYDELGQLIQVNDHSDTRSGENGTTWKYTYDLGGNILKKERFVYNDTTNPLETVTYEYGDANWRDKLTAVNGSTIRYDAIGNPLSDGTWTYTWQNGRQLQKMQKSGVTAEFVYNADGLRVQKTVNGVVTKYTLHGKNIVHMISGADELHIFYDAQNRPAVVVYNGTAYAYVKSLQGDIVAILDENGNTVVSYGYDAWGSPLWCTGELAETLGKVQPFRYRGYVFDEETGLYYLRSRYYNPQWGRFANADALIDQNLYSYCKNSPMKFHDPSGYREELDDPFMEVFDSMTDKVEKPTIYTKVKFSRKLCREYIIRNSGLKIQEYKHSAPPITRIFTIGPNFAEGTSLVLSGIDSAGIIIDVIRTQEIAYAEDCAILGRTYTDAAFMFDEYNYVIVEAIYNDTLGEMKFSFYDEQDNLMGVSAVASFSSVRAPGDFFYDLVLTAQQQRIPYGLEGRDRDFSLRYN
jgi:RHS repeat-associated protein